MKVTQEISQKAKTDLEEQLLEELKPDLSDWTIVPEERIMAVAYEGAIFDYDEMARQPIYMIIESSWDVHLLHYKYKQFQGFIKNGSEYEAAKKDAEITDKQIELVDNWIWDAEIQRLDYLMTAYNLIKLEGLDGQDYYAVPNKHLEELQ